MKTKLTLLMFILSFNLFAADIYKYNLEGAKNKKMKLIDFKGKAILFVNIATRCGYTPQLDGLEKLYKNYKEKGLVVIGIPSNDFGGQTPESNEEVSKFCKLNYGVTFPLTKKTVVKGKNKSQLYKYLTGLTNNSEIGWNFTKFLFDKNGKLVKRYSSSVSPSSKKLINGIKKAIKLNDKNRY